MTLAHTHIFKLLVLVLLSKEWYLCFVNGVAGTSGTPTSGTRAVSKDDSRDSCTHTHTQTRGTPLAVV